MTFFNKMNSLEDLSSRRIVDKYRTIFVRRLDLLGRCADRKKSQVLPWDFND